MTDREGRLDILGVAGVFVAVVSVIAFDRSFFPAVAVTVGVIAMVVSFVVAIRGGPRS